MAYTVVGMLQKKTICNSQKNVRGHENQYHFCFFW